MRSGTLRLAAAAAATLGMVTAASAADLAVKAPVYTKAPAPVPSSWAGGYIGIEGGFGPGHSDQTDSAPPLTTADGHYSLQGGFIGGTLGYNWQSGPWVYGLEGDYSWADISGQSDVCGPSSLFGPHPCGTKLNDYGTFRGRLGYAFGQRGEWLVYGTGGLAVGDVHGWDSAYPSSGSAFLTGWAAGGGVETAFAQNWTFKVEYLHMDLGKKVLFDVDPVVGVPETVSFKADLVRFGVNYHFSGPVVAKY